MNQASVPVNKQTTGGISVNQTSALIKQEQNGAESLDARRLATEQAPQSTMRPGQTVQATKANQQQYDVQKMQRLVQLIKETQTIYRSGPVLNMSVEEKDKMRKLLVQVQP